jgi:hypothetical protein
MKRDSQIIRDLAIHDHIEGERPFATELFERTKVQAIPVQNGDCPHCGGIGRCECPMCSLRRTSEPTPCSMCQMDAHRIWLEVMRPAEDWFSKEKEMAGGL